MDMNEYSARKEALAEREISAIQSGNTDEFYRIHSELDVLDNEFQSVQEIKEPSPFGNIARKIGKAALGLSALAGLALTGAAKDMAGSTLDDNFSPSYSEDNGAQFYTDDLDNITYNYKETAPFELYSECSSDPKVPFRLKINLADNYTAEHSNFYPTYNQTSFGLESDEDGNILLTQGSTVSGNIGYNGIHDIFMISRFDSDIGTVPFLSNMLINFGDKDDRVVDYDMALELSTEKNGEVIHLKKPLDDRYYDEDNLDKNFSHNEYEIVNWWTSETTPQKSDKLNDALSRLIAKESRKTYLELKISELISENNLTDADTLDLKLTRSLPSAPLVNGATTNINYDSKNNPRYPYFPQVIVPINAELGAVPIDIDMGCYETEVISDELILDSNETILESMPIIETETKKPIRFSNSQVALASGLASLITASTMALANREYKQNDSLDGRSPLPKLREELIKD